MGAAAIEYAKQQTKTMELELGMADHLVGMLRVNIQQLYMLQYRAFTALPALTDELIAAPCECFICASAKAVTYQHGSYVICRNCYYVCARGDYDKNILRAYPAQLAEAQARIMHTFTHAQFSKCITWEQRNNYGSCTLCGCQDKKSYGTWTPIGGMRSSICRACMGHISVHDQRMQTWAVCICEAVSVLPRDVRGYLVGVIWSVSLIPNI